MTKKHLQEYWRKRLTKKAGPEEPEPRQLPIRGLPEKFVITNRGRVVDVLGVDDNSHDALRRLCKHPEFKNQRLAVVKVIREGIYDGYFFQSRKQDIADWTEENL